MCMELRVQSVGKIVAAYSPTKYGTACDMFSHKVAHFKPGRKSRLHAVNRQLVKDRP